MLAHTPSRASQLRCLPHQQQQCKEPRFQHKHRRTHTVSTRAQMGGMLDTMVTWGALAAGAGAVAYSLFYDRKQQPKQQQQQEAPLFGPPDNMSWAVMGVVSCIPFFNYLAFAQGALTSENPRLWYWAAALYAMPLLRNGFELDWFSTAMVVLGAAHVQVLRIGATEPELQARLQQQLKPLAVMQTLASAAGTAAGAALGTGGSRSSAGGHQLGEGSSRAVMDVLQPDEGELEAEEAARQRQELEEFDRRLRQGSGKDD